MCSPPPSPAHPSFSFPGRAVGYLPAGVCAQGPFLGGLGSGEVHVVLQGEVLLGEGPRPMQAEPTLIKQTRHIVI